MQKIEKIEELKNEYLRLDEVVYFPDIFPFFNLRRKPKAFWFLDYVYPLETEFFAILSIYCKNIGDKGFTYLTIDPTPINSHYHKITGYFNAAKFSIDDKSKCLERFVYDNYEKDKFESIYTTLTTYAILSASNSWVIYGDYHAATAVFATFVDSEANKILFLEPYFSEINDFANWLKTIKYRIDIEAFKLSWKKQKLILP